MSSINLWTREWALKKKHPCFYFPEVSSTHDVAKKEFHGQSPFALYLSDHQTHGRGRNQSHWFNLQNGEVLLSTWCFALDKSPQPILTPLLGLALYQSLDGLEMDLPLRLKAPNDLFLQEGKLSGLLVEVNQRGQKFEVYVGLGMNVFAAPKVDQTTACLHDFVALTEASWQVFCENLFNKFTHAIESGTQTQLSATAQEELLQALNQGLPAKKRFLKISPSGDLYTATGILPWMDL